MEDNAAGGVRKLPSGLLRSNVLAIGQAESPTDGVALLFEHDANDSRLIGTAPGT